MRRRKPASSGCRSRTARSVEDAAIGACGSPRRITEPKQSRSPGLHRARTRSLLTVAASAGMTTARRAGFPSKTGGSSSRSRRRHQRHHRPHRCDQLTAGSASNGSSTTAPAPAASSPMSWWRTPQGWPHAAHRLERHDGRAVDAQDAALRQREVVCADYVIAAAPVVIGANLNLPAKHRWGDDVGAAKKQPGKLQQYASRGRTFLHLAGELFKLPAASPHIPFKGAGPAMTDVIGGHTQLVFASIGSPRRLPPGTQGARRRLRAATA